MHISFGLTRWSAFLVSLVALLAACTPPATPSPTAAPAGAVPATASASSESQPAATVPAGEPAKPAAKPPATPAASVAFDEQAVADFYRGKTIRVIVGASPGGGHDTYSRMLSRHIPEHIPGNPTIIVENKPGAASALATNLVYNVEPKDGTVINHFNESFVLLQALGLGEGFEFDVTRLNWLGSASKSVAACAIRTDLGIGSLRELINSKRELVFATIGPGTVSQDVPAVLNEALGTPFRLVSGYQGSSDLLLATERREADGFCQTFDGLANTARQQLEGDQPALKVLVVTGSTTPDHPFLQGVPAAETLAASDEARRLLRAIHAPLQIGRPWVVAPGVPAERVEALRAAYLATMADPDFLAEAERLNLHIDPSSGAEVMGIVQDLMSMPAAQRDKLRALLD